MVIKGNHHVTIISSGTEKLELATSHKSILPDALRCAECLIILTATSFSISSALLRPAQHLKLLRFTVSSFLSSSTRKHPSTLTTALTAVGLPQTTLQNRYFSRTRHKPHINSQSYSHQPCPQTSASPPPAEAVPRATSNATTPS